MRYTILCDTNNGEQPIIWSLKLTPNSPDCRAAVLLSGMGGSEELTGAGGRSWLGRGQGQENKKLMSRGQQSVQWPGWDQQQIPCDMFHLHFIQRAALHKMRTPTPNISSVHNIEQSWSFGWSILMNIFKIFCRGSPRPVQCVQGFNPHIEGYLSFLPWAAPEQSPQMDCDFHAWRCAGAWNPTMQLWSVGI